MFFWRKTQAIEETASTIASDTLTAACTIISELNNRFALKLTDIEISDAQIAGYSITYFGALIGLGGVKRDRDRRALFSNYTDRLEAKIVYINRVRQLHDEVLKYRQAYGKWINSSEGLSENLAAIMLKNVLPQPYCFRNDIKLEMARLFSLWVESVRVCLRASDLS
jgi:hypothetical protein